MDEETKKQISHIHDFCIRMESTVKCVDSLMKWRDGDGTEENPGARHIVLETDKSVKDLIHWRDGNGIPGAKFQLRIMWAIFLAGLAKIWK